MKATINGIILEGTPEEIGKYMSEILKNIGSVPSHKIEPEYFGMKLREVSDWETHWEVIQ